MSHITTNISLKAATPSTIWMRVRQYAYDLFQAWEQERKIQRTMLELYALSDRELNDIGIVRCDIERVVRSF